MSRLFQCFVRCYRDLSKFVEKYEDVSPEDSVRSCWQRDTRVTLTFLAYRWVQFILHTLFELMSFLDINRNYSAVHLVSHGVKKTAKYYMKWLLYLTHWGLVLNVLESFVGALVVHKAYEKQNHSPSRARSDVANGVNSPTKILINVYSYLFSVALHLSTYITLGYWLLVYDPTACDVDLVTLSEHGFGATLLFIDLFMTNIPYKMMGGVCTVGISLVYLMLTYVHHLLHALDRFQDKPFIYEKSDWNQPEVVIIYYLFSVFVMASFHLSLWGLFLLRKRLKNAVHRLSSSPQSSPPRAS